MEAPKVRRSSNRGTNGRPDSLKEKFEPRRVVVAVDATRELKLAALQYALRNFVRPGDKLYLLGILHQVLTPGGSKEKADLTQFTGTKKYIIQEEIRKKKAEFEQGISNSELQQLVEVKQVIPVVHIAAGPDRKVVTAQQAMQLRASWLILDQNLKKEKVYLMEQLNCNLVLMKPKNEAGVIRLEVRELQNPNENNGAPAIIPSRFSHSNNAQVSPITTPSAARIRKTKSEVVELGICSPGLLCRTSSNSNNPSMGKSVQKTFKPKASAARIRKTKSDVVELKICSPGLLWRTPSSSNNPSVGKSVQKTFKSKANFTYMEMLQDIR
ncbi:unnamed protein product [Calypogeia fissa]